MINTGNMVKTDYGEIGVVVGFEYIFGDSKYYKVRTTHKRRWIDDFGGSSEEQQFHIVVHYQVEELERIK